MIEEIEKAKAMGDTLGGVMEVIGINIPVGLGSHAHWDRKLDGKIAGGILSNSWNKGYRNWFRLQWCRESRLQFHDEIYYNNGFIEN